MKKKHNFRGKIVFGTLLVFSIFVFNTNVYAKEKDIGGNVFKYDIDDSGCDDQSKFPNANDRKQCHEKAKECDTNLTNEVLGYNIQPNLIGNKFYYTIGKVTGITVGGIKVTNDGKSISSGSQIANSITTVKFSATLKKDISFTSSTGQKIDIKCSGNFEKNYMYDITTPPSGSTIVNAACKQNTGVCWKYVNKKKVGNDKLDGSGLYSYASMENLGKVEIKENNGAVHSYNFLEYLYKNFPYCDCSKSYEVEYKLEDDYIKKTILLLAQTFKANDEVKKKTKKIKEKTKTEIKFDADAILVDKTDLNNFTCTAFGPQSFKTNGELEHPDKYKAIKDEKGKIIAYNNYRKFAKKGPVKTVKYTNQEGKQADVCSVQCGEQVEVSYGPPITAKAGICFEYIITVKSKIQCESKIKEENAPVPPAVTTQNFKTCRVSAQCNNSGGFLKTQAGPNEEFDKCIQEKFNGKYTQKAINYCYKKVYKKSKVTKTSSYLEDASVEKMATSYCPWWNNKTELDKIAKSSDYKASVKVCDKDGKNCRNETKGIDDVVKELYDSIHERGEFSGKYDLVTTSALQYGDYHDNGILAAGIKKYKWRQTRNCYWDKYADLYKNDKTTAKALVNDDELFAEPSSKECSCNDISSRCCARNIAKRTDIYYEANNHSKTRVTIQDEAAHRFYKAVNGIKKADYIAGSAFAGSNSTGAHQSRGWLNNDCGEKCYIYTTDTNCAMPGDNATNPEIKSKDWEKYQAALDRYDKALAECGVEAKCTEDGDNDKHFTTTKETTYTMRANECTEINSDGRCTKRNQNTGKVCAIESRTDDSTTCDVKGAEECRYWSQTNGKNKNSRIQVEGKGHDKSIIINDAIGFCYGDTSGNYHYINSISFPGYWTADGKDSKEVNPHCSATRLMDFQKNAFCVSPNLPSINRKWAIWDQGDGKDIAPRGPINKVLTNNDYVTKSDSVGKNYIEYKAADADYNIEGHFKNFGYLDWNLDFSCFYAINNISPPGEDCDPNAECCNESCPRKKKNTIENIDTKPISLDNLFPNTDSTTKDMSSVKKSEEIIPKKLNATTSDTGNIIKVADTNTTETNGRTPGYNWSCDSASVKIKDPKNSSNDYIIAPISLRKKIEEDNTKIFDENDKSELDYSITLTSDNIKEIRKFNKTKKNGYYDFSEGISEDEDEVKKEVKSFKVDDDNNFTIRFFKSALLRNKGGNYVKNFSGNYNYCNNMKQNGDITNGALTSCDNLNEIRKGSTCEEERK